MSLGPPGASMNPEQGENFEDVSEPTHENETFYLWKPDGKAIRGQRSNFATGPLLQVLKR